MPVGRLTEEEYEREMRQGKKESHTRATKEEESHPTVPDTTPGRGAGTTNVPDTIRKIIGETAVIDGRSAALQLSRDLGVSASSTSAYAKGATSTASYNTPSQSILQHINKSRVRAVKRASNTLNAALGSITQEKLDYSDAKDLSAIAKDMSVIIKNLEPPAEQPEAESSKSPRFVIFAPQFRKEETFEVITVQE